MTLLLKVRGFPALFSEEHAGRGVSVEEEAVKDEQENLVAGRYSKHFFISQGVLAQDAWCFCLGS